MITQGLFRHTDTGITNRNGMMFLVSDNSYFQIGISFQLFFVSQRQEADLVQGIRSILGQDKIPKSTL